MENEQLFNEILDLIADHIDHYYTLGCGTNELSRHRFYRGALEALYLFKDELEDMYLFLVAEEELKKDNIKN